MIRALRKLNISVMRAFCALLVLGLVTIFSPEVLAQTYPTKPIRIIVATSAGASVDNIARLIGVKLTEALGQQIIVDNRDGAGGRIGGEVAARSAPDGYTLFMINGSQTIIPAMYKDLKYNLVKDFSPISLVGTTPAILVVNPRLPVTSVKELVTLAKARPGALKYGSSGYGSTPHLSAEIFKFMTGTDILHVPYKAAPAAWTGTMTGEVDMVFQPLTGLMPLMKSGRLRALGAASAKRTPLIPDLPSISESVPGFEFMMWQGLIAPAKTPPEILWKLNTEVNRALNTPIVREKMAALGNEPSGCSQKDFALYISKDLDKMREAISLSGAKPED